MTSGSIRLIGLFAILVCCGGCTMGGYSAVDAVEMKKNLEAAIPPRASSHEVRRILIEAFHADPRNISRRTVSHPAPLSAEPGSPLVSDSLYAMLRTHRHLLSPGLTDFLVAEIFFDSEDRFIDLRAEVHFGK